MTFVFPDRQRVLTNDEYALLGYQVRGVAPSFERGKPIERNYLPAYRAPTKEKFAVDLGMGIAKVGYAITTGGVFPAAKTALGYTLSLVS